MTRVILTILILFELAGAQGSALLIQLDTTKGQAKVDLLNHLVLEYEYVNPDSADYFVKQAIKLAEKIGYQYGLSDAFQYYGYLMDDRGNYYGSLEQFEKSMNILLELKDTVRIARLNNNFGIIYYDMGQFDKALKHYYAALELQEFHIKDSFRISVINGNIANVMIKTDDQDEALRRLKKALSYYISQGDSLRESITLGNISSVYINMKKYEKATVALKKALQINVVLDNKYGEGITLSNMAMVYSRKEEKDSALLYGARVIKIWESLGDQYYLTSSIRNMATYLAAAGDFAGAEEQASKAVIMAKEYGILELMAESYLIQSSVFTELKKHQEALNSYKLHAHVKDSMFNEDKSKEIGKIEAKYDFEKADAEKKRIETEKLTQHAKEKTRSDNLQFSGIFIFLALLGAGILAMGKLSIPVRMIEGLVFFTFLLFFEFLLVLLDPTIESVSGGAPAYKLLFNAVLAALIFPLHSFFENRIKKRLN